MNKLFSFALLLCATVLFSSCLKDDDTDPVEVPSAGVMAFNLAPDQQSVVIRLSGNSLTQTPIAFTNYTGVYQRVYTGDRDVQSFDYPDPTPLASGSFNFQQDKLYSLFVVGADDKYKNVVVLDDVDSLDGTTGKAYVRYINAITDTVNALNVAVTSGGSEVVNAPASFSDVSDFKEVSVGELVITAKNSELDLSRTIAVQAGKVYTILLLGQPGATDDTRKPQIKFVENGTLSSEEK